MKDKEGKAMGARRRRKGKEGKGQGERKKVANDKNVKFYSLNGLTFFR